MTKRSWIGGHHRRLTVMFLAVLLPPAVALIWLGLQMLEQDRALEARRELEGREASAEAIVKEIGRALHELQITSGVEGFPEGALRIVAAPAGVRAQPEGIRLWSEKLPALPESASAPFAEAEATEYRGDPESALRTYREFTRSPDAGIRAGAFLRVARVERNLQHPDVALDAYRNLAGMSGIAFDGTPADFIARRAICGLLSDSGRHEELRAEATGLETDFLANRWTLDRPRWELAAGEIAAWTGRPLDVSPSRLPLSNAADWVGQRFRDGALATSNTHIASQIVPVDDQSVTVIWRRTTSPEQPARFEAIALAPAVIIALIDRALRDEPDRAGGILLLGYHGETTFVMSWPGGNAPKSGEPTAREVRRSLNEVNLPWTLVLSASDQSRAAANLEGRRRLLGWGLAAIVLLLAGGSYFLWRATGRELAVARLQSDFVAAVSHEFRTPLTSLASVTELLQEDDGLPPGPEKETRTSFYAALARNTDRLRRLVESLLDFSRMETGRKPWHLELLDAGALTTRVVAEFQKEMDPRGVRVDCTVNHPDALLLRADADALGHALWNLLDNAVKYSDASGAIHVEARREAERIVISVSDQGIGIPARERRRIFQKFVRGEKATELGIKGTGLGLAIVAHIVEAHGGVIELETEEGKGSTFKLVFPLEAQV